MSSMHEPRTCGSSTESAVEEETVGLSIPYEEEERSVGDELEGSGPAGQWPLADGDGSCCACFRARLVHVDVSLVEDVPHPEVITTSDAT